MLNWKQFKTVEKTGQSLEKIENRIRFAIRNGLVLRVKYKSKAQNVSPKWRNIAPVALVKANKGTKFIQGWQLGGYSHSDGRTNAQAIWRSFSMDRMHQVEMTDMKLKTPPQGFTGGAKDGQEILVVTDYDAIRKAGDQDPAMQINAEKLDVMLDGSKIEDSVIWKQRNQWATLLNSESDWAIVLSKLPIRDKVIEILSKGEKSSWYVIETDRLNKLKDSDLIQDKKLLVFIS